MTERDDVVVTERDVWFTDRYGGDVEDDVTVEHLDELLDTIEEPDGDDEHASISVSDSDEWNLEYYRESVLFENVDVGGGRVGSLRGLTRDERLAIGAEFLVGDFDAINARPWES